MNDASINPVVGCDASQPVVSPIATSQAAGANGHAGSADRNAALDFTKGILVLLMVLYHWLNYFVSADGDFYRYLRFITPSFIFITGFLIASVYLARYRVGDPRLHVRLVQRGFKLLALFTCLNVAASLLLTRGAQSWAGGLAAFLQNAKATYVTGNGKTAAFAVLVPISYVLILSSVLILPAKTFKLFLPAVCALLCLGIFILNLFGLGSGNLELITIGLLGIVLGRIPIQRINALAEHYWFIVLAFGVYLVALIVWNATFPLQIAGVCLNLLFIYLVGTKCGDCGLVRRWVVLLGNYTLLAYIAQIAVLVVLAALLRRIQLADGVRLAASFLSAFGLATLVVKLVDSSRSKWAPADRLYKLVFA